jgi:hypothetical protein
MQPDERRIILQVLPRRMRRTVFVYEDGVPVNYGDEGWQADLPQLEALEKLSTGNFTLASGEELTVQETRFLEALCDPRWPARNGHIPTIEEFA